MVSGCMSACASPGRAVSDPVPAGTGPGAPPTTAQMQMTLIQNGSYFLHVHVGTGHQVLVWGSGYWAPGGQRPT
jgi:hypothetical protein